MKWLIETLIVSTYYWIWKLFCYNLLYWGFGYKNGCYRKTPETRTSQIKRILYFNKPHFHSMHVMCEELVLDAVCDTSMQYEQTSQVRNAHAHSCLLLQLYAKKCVRILSFYTSHVFVWHHRYILTILFHSKNAT